VRDIDPGIGDSWRVPIGNDWYFCMIDVPDNGYLLKGGCSGAPIVDGITELALVGDLVVGKGDASRPFVLDTRTGVLQTLSSRGCRPRSNCAAADSAERRRVLRQSTMGKR
jgi:hypothetical protein